MRVSGFGRRAANPSLCSARQVPEWTADRQRFLQSRAEVGPGLFRPATEPGLQAGVTTQVLQRLAELPIEGLVPPEVDVLQPAGSILHALPADHLVTVRVESGILACDQDLPLLFPQPSEGRAVPVVHEASFRRITERLVIGEHQQTAGI